MRSALDVGAGKGAVSRPLTEAGIRTTALEVASTVPPDASTYRAVGHAEALPFTDQSFDLVVLRHVLHHSRAPARVLTEALRVTRHHVLVAEPFHTPTVAGQRLSATIERWMRARDRAAGRVHDDDIPPAEIIEMIRVAGGRAHDPEWALTHEPWDPDLIERTGRALLAEAPDEEAARTFDRLLATAREEGVTCNGSFLVTMTRSE